MTIPVLTQLDLRPIRPEETPGHFIEGLGPERVLEHRQFAGYYRVDENPIFTHGNRVESSVLLRIETFARSCPATPFRLETAAVLPIYSQRLVGATVRRFAAYSEARASAISWLESVLPLYERAMREAVGAAKRGPVATYTPGAVGWDPYLGCDVCGVYVINRARHPRAAQRCEECGPEPIQFTPPGWMLRAA